MLQGKVHYQPKAVLLIVVYPKLIPDLIILSDSRVKHPLNMIAFPLSSTRGLRSTLCFMDMLDQTWITGRSLYILSYEANAVDHLNLAVDATYMIYKPHCSCALFLQVSEEPEVKKIKASIC